MPARRHRPKRVGAEPVFGPAYFRKFYLNPRSRVTTPAEMRARAQLIAAILVQAGIPVRTILDAGCGIGLLGREVRRAIPRAAYLGLEVSEYLCRRYGWQRGRIEEYRKSPRTWAFCASV